MKTLAPGIQQWSWFSAEKQIDFNGLLLTVNEHCIVVDPPPMESADRTVMLKSRIDYVLITNRDHAREAESFRRDFNAKIYVPATDAPLMEITADKTYQDGELLPGGIWVIHLQDMKSPGESALFLERGKGYLIVGDALLGKPAGELSLLSPEKFADAGKAKDGLKRLLKYQFDTVLVGDGISIMTGGKEAVGRLLES